MKKKMEMSCKASKMPKGMKKEEVKEEKKEMKKKK